MKRPAYTRLRNEDRRKEVVDQAAALFATHGYDELSMAKIARAAGISKPLLYHYFPGKSELFAAALAQQASELERRVALDSDLPPAEQLNSSVAAYLDWIDENRRAYTKLMHSAQIPEVRDVVDRVREDTAQRILERLGDDGRRPATRAAVKGWLWFMDGACLDWLERGEMSKTELHGLILGTFVGSLLASGAQPVT